MILFTNLKHSQTATLISLISFVRNNQSNQLSFQRISPAIKCITQCISLVQRRRKRKKGSIYQQVTKRLKLIRQQSLWQRMRQLDHRMKYNEKELNRTRKRQRETVEGCIVCLICESSDLFPDIVRNLHTHLNKRGPFLISIQSCPDCIHRIIKKSKY